MSLIRAVLMGTVIGVPLFVLGDFTNDPYGVPKLALLIAGVGVATGVRAARLFRGGPIRGARQLFVPAAAFAIPMTISWAASPHRAWAFLGSYARHSGWLPYVLVVLLGLLLADAFWRRPGSLAWALATAGGLVGTIAFLQALGIGPLWSPGVGGASEYPPSTIGHFNFVGGFLALTLPLSLHLWADTTARGRRLMAIWATVAGVLGLAMANSQGGWAAALAGSVLISGSYFSTRRPKARAVAMLAAGGIAAVVIGAVIASLFVRGVAVLDGTVQTRGLLWVTAIEMGTDAPIIGHGPAAYSLEGVRYRPLTSVLAEGPSADEPHSVPLTFWANGGALGALGFAAFLVWVITTGARIRLGDHRSMAFFASIVAYLVQSFVSIDFTPLRVGLWTAMAGLVISMKAPTDPTPDPELPVRTQPRWRLLAPVTALLVGGASVWYAGALTLADHRVISGLGHFEEGDVPAGRLEFRRALDLRDEPRYRKLLGDALGSAALDREDRGEPLIDEMRMVYAYLDGFPEISGLLSQARILHDWSRFEPSARHEALGILDRARLIDPENPEIDIRTAEVLVDLDEVDGARALLEPWGPSLQGDLATFWGALASVRLIDQDIAGARAALSEGVALGPRDCRVVMAGALMDRHADPSGGLSGSEELAFRFNCGDGAFSYMTRLMSRLGG